MLRNRLRVQCVLRSEARITGTTVRQVTQRHHTTDAGGPDTGRLQRVQHRLPHTLSRCQMAFSFRLRATTSHRVQLVRK